MSDRPGYDDAFFAFTGSAALDAAQLVLPGVLARTNAQRVIDVGCGTGAWLVIAAEFGREIHGVDGYVPEDRLDIPPQYFLQTDLEGGVDCSTYDLAICLEVAEHLDATAAPALVAGLCKARFVLWSAAIPDQGGMHHVNEQWPSYWAPLFGEHGFYASEDIRQAHWTDDRISDFYRQNLLIWGTPEDLEAAGYVCSGTMDLVHPDLAKAKGWTE